MVGKGPAGGSSGSTRLGVAERARQAGDDRAVEEVAAAVGGFRGDGSFTHLTETDVGREVTGVGSEGVV